MDRNKKNELLNALVEKHGKEIYQMALSLTNNEAMAKDVVQEAFLSVYVNCDHIHPGKEVGYLKTCVENGFTSILRKEKHRSDLSYEDTVDKEATTLSAENEYLIKTKMELRKALGSNIMERLRDKKPSWYEIIYKSYYLNKTAEEIAKELGISAKAVYHRRDRALQWIHTHFKDEIKEIH